MRAVLYTVRPWRLAAATLLGLLPIVRGFLFDTGRVGEDLRTGIGSLVAATPVSNRLFLISRWCGGVLYFMLPASLCRYGDGDGFYNWYAVSRAWKF